MQRRGSQLTGLAVVGLVGATGLAMGPAAGLAATPRHGAKILETTPGGYTLRVSVASSGQSGRLALGCPGGRSLGSSARFDVHRGTFTAIRVRSGQRVFRFSGRFDQPDHVRGSGSVHRGACGSGVSSSFSEGSVGTAQMLSCPASSPETPLAANTPYPFSGIVPNAAQGTRLRLEYTDPNSSTGQSAVVHLTTDAGGRFADVHAFPSSGGSVYGASAIPRHPDDPLAPGQGCGVQVQG